MTGPGLVHSSVDKTPELSRIWRQRLQQRPGLAVSIAASVALAIGAGITFLRATTPWARLPDYDYWANITGLITEHGAVLDLASLFRHNNEHIVVVPKLIYLVNYLLTSGSNIGLLVYSICAGAACAIFLLVLAGDLLRDMPARWLLCGVLFPLAIFSAKLSHSYYFGMSGTIWLTADLFVILSAAAMTRAAQTGSAAWLLASLLAALLGVLTYSTAVYSLVVLLVFCAALLLAPRFRGRIPWPALIGVAAVVLFVLAVWLLHCPHPKGHPPLDFDPIGLTGFVLIYLGAAVSEGYFAPVAGLAILLCAGIAIHQLIAIGRGKDILLWVTLFLFAPFNALMTGIGRLGFGLKSAFSSRYQSVAAISLMAAIVLLLAALPRKSASRPSYWIKAAAAALFLAMGVFFLINAKSAAFYAKHLEKKPVVEIALRLGIPGDHHLAAVMPSIEKLYQIIPALRATQHVPFDTRTRCEEFMGQRLPTASGEPVGAVETMAPYTVSHDTRTAIELSGWAIQSGKVAECIAVIDADGIVIGAGTTASMHPDPVTTGLLRIGWQAVANEPTHLPVCGMALFPGDSAWRPLANCQSLPLLP